MKTITQIIQMKKEKKTMKIKRAVSIILTLIMIVSTFAIFGSFSVSAETGYDRGYKQTMAGTGKVVAE